jgi:hypothetical protein
VYVSPDITKGGGCYMHAGVWWRNVKEIVRLEDLSVDRKMILKWISKKWD